MPYFGATAVGVKAKDGVVLASERRLTYGGYIMSRSARKVFRITDRLGIAFAGFFADLQALSKLLRAEVRFYEVTSNREISIRSAAKLLSNIMYSRKLIPYLSEAIVAGIDSEGPHLYVLDPIGSLIEDDYAALGSGASIAIGVIESEYREGLGLDEAKKVAVEAVRAAIKRDAGSGDGIDVLILGASGTSEEYEKV